MCASNKIRLFKYRKPTLCVAGLGPSYESCEALPREDGSSYTLTNVLPHRNAMPQTRGMIGNHGIVWITHCRWLCGSLVMQRPLLLLMSLMYKLLLSLMYHCYCLWRINFKPVWEKTDCTDLWVIKLTNQVSPSSGFRVAVVVMLFVLLAYSLVLSSCTYTYGRSAATQTSCLS